MAVRADLIATTATVLNGGFTTLYTVPEGRTLIVRHWSAVNHHSAALTLRLSVRSGTLTTDVVRLASLAQGDYFPGRDFYLPLDPGVQCLARVDGASGSPAVHVVLAGSLLFGANLG